MKVLFLYTELAGYVRHCFEMLANAGADVSVVAYPVNPEAPFEFNDHSSKVTYLSRKDYDEKALARLVDEIAPDAIFCSGWIDQGYNEVLRHFKNRIKTVLISDNAFAPDPRTRLSVFRARWSYRHLYQEAFVAGPPQQAYAEKMGFPRDRIHQGFYSADVERFASMKNANFNGEFPKRLVFVGRYLPFKGIYDLWEAFSELGETDWVLHCYGSGADWPKRIRHPRIVHHGFVQPQSFHEIIENGGIFVLPSLREPWGVVVHEFAAAGFPLILSDKVNAGSLFLKRGVNGVIFRSGDKSDLLVKMKSIMNLSVNELFAMARESKDLAYTFTPEKWVRTVERILNQHR
jgi:glycosyltransferase involved in cell wall biosynthesis